MFQILIRTVTHLAVNFYTVTSLHLFHGLELEEIYGCAMLDKFS